MSDARALADGWRTRKAWVKGDRVRLTPTGRSRDWRTGTVREVDPPAPHGIPGVLVDLDEPLNGGTECFASHDELWPAESPLISPERQEALRVAEDGLDAAFGRKT